jgi:predicted nucleic acid-binding Zn ribbon protein
VGGGRRVGEPERLGAILDALGRERRLEAGLALGTLARRWEEVVGERLAAECRPSALRRGTLVVEASSGAWAAQVRFLAREVGRRANELLEREEVRDVRVVVAVGGARGGGEGRPRGASPRT